MLQLNRPKGENRSVPPKALKYLQRTEEQLAQLPFLWENGEETELWWDSLNKVFATVRARDTYSAVYGTAVAQAGRNLIRRFQRGVPGILAPRWAGPVRLETAVPTDSIINIRSWRGGVLLSASETLAVKFVSSKWVESWERESRALGLATSAGLTRHIPALLASGQLARGDYYLISSLAPNSKPFVTRFDSLLLKEWQPFVMSELIPVLGSFYRASNIELCPIEDVVDSLNYQMTKISDVEAMLCIRELLNRHVVRSESPIVKALIHADISPHHVHRTCNNWWLIDWGNSVRGPVIYDFFRVYMFGMHPRSARRRDFWKWLTRESGYSDLPSSLVQDIESCIALHNNYLGQRVDADDLRSQCILYVLEKVIEWLSAPMSQIANSARAQRRIEKAYITLGLLGYQGRPLFYDQATQ